MTSKPRRVVALLAIGLSLLGCSQSELRLDRLAISGQVTAGADKLVDGAISFIPEDGNSGPAVTTAIAKGEYHFDMTNGPIAGKYKVIIAPRVEGKSSRTLPVAGSAATDQGPTDRALAAAGREPHFATVTPHETTFDFDLQ